MRHCSIGGLSHPNKGGGVWGGIVWSSRCHHEQSRIVARLGIVAMANSSTDSGDAYWIRMHWRMSAVRLTSTR